jgi:hypothetical protein
VLLIKALGGGWNQTELPDNAMLNDRAATGSSKPAAK